VVTMMGILLYGKLMLIHNVVMVSKLVQKHLLVLVRVLKDPFKTYPRFLTSCVQRLSSLRDFEHIKCESSGRLLLKKHENSKGIVLDNFLDFSHHLSSNSRKMS